MDQSQFPYGGSSSGFGRSPLFDLGSMSRASGTGSGSGDNLQLAPIYSNPQHQHQRETINDILTRYQGPSRTHLAETYDDDADYADNVESHMGFNEYGAQVGVRMSRTHQTPFGNARTHVGLQMSFGYGGGMAIRASSSASLGSGGRRRLLLMRNSDGGSCHSPFCQSFFHPGSGTSPPFGNPFSVFGGMFPSSQGQYSQYDEMEFGQQRTHRPFENIGRQTGTDGPIIEELTDEDEYEHETVDANKKEVGPIITEITDIDNSSVHLGLLPDITNIEDDQDIKKEEQNSRSREFNYNAQNDTEDPDKTHLDLESESTPENSLPLEDKLKPNIATENPTLNDVTKDTRNTTRSSNTDFVGAETNASTEKGQKFSKKSFKNIPFKLTDNDSSTFSFLSSLPKDKEADDTSSPVKQVNLESHKHITVNEQKTASKQKINKNAVPKRRNDSFNLAMPEDESTTLEFVNKHVENTPQGKDLKQEPPSPNTGRNVQENITEEGKRKCSLKQASDTGVDINESVRETTERAPSPMELVYNRETENPTENPEQITEQPITINEADLKDLLFQDDGAVNCVELTYDSEENADFTKVTVKTGNDTPSPDVTTNGTKLEELSIDTHISDDLSEDTTHCNDQASSPIMTYVSDHDVHSGWQTSDEELHEVRSKQGENFIQEERTHDSSISVTSKEDLTKSEYLKSETDIKTEQNGTKSNITDNSHNDSIKFSLKIALDTDTRSQTPNTKRSKESTTGISSEPHPESSSIDKGTLFLIAVYPRREDRPVTTIMSKDKRKIEASARFSISHNQNIEQETNRSSLYQYQRNSEQSRANMKTFRDNSLFENGNLAQNQDNAGNGNGPVEMPQYDDDNFELNEVGKKGPDTEFTQHTAQNKSDTPRPSASPYQGNAYSEDYNTPQTERKMSDLQNSCRYNEEPENSRISALNEEYCTDINWQYPGQTQYNAKTTMSRDEFHQKHTHHDYHHNSSAALLNDGSNHMHRHHIEHHNCSEAMSNDAISKHRDNDDHYGQNQDSHVHACANCQRRHHAGCKHNHIQEVYNRCCKVWRLLCVDCQTLFTHEAYNALKQDDDDDDVLQHTEWKHLHEFGDIDNQPMKPKPSRGKKKVNKNATPYKTSAPSTTTPNNQGNTSPRHSPYNQQTDFADLVASVGLEVKDVYTYGNCLFTAVCDQLRIRADFSYTPRQLRKAAVDYLTDHPNQEDGTPLLEFLADEERNWEKYLRSMRRDGHWGDHIVIWALTHVLNRRIVIYRYDGQMELHKTVVEPKSFEKDTKEVKTDTNSDEKQIPPMGDNPQSDQRGDVKEESVQSTDDLILGHVSQSHYVSLRLTDWRERLLESLKNKKDSCLVGSNPESKHLDSNEDVSVGRSVLSVSPDDLNYFLNYLSRGGSVIIMNRKSSPAKSEITCVTHDIYNGFEYLFLSKGAIKKDIGMNAPTSWYSPPDTKVVTHQRTATAKDLVIHNENCDVGQFRLVPISTALWNAKLQHVKGIAFLKHIVFNESKDEKNKYVAFNCSSWPDDAMEWINRQRNTGWPDKSTIDRVVQKGVRVSPVKTKYNEGTRPLDTQDVDDATDDQAIIWEYNFAIAEYTLCHVGFCDEAKMLHAQLDIFLRFVFEGKDMISRDHLKALTFFLSERCSSEEMKREPGRCFMYGIDMLIDFLQSKHFPHYFMRGRNLIAGMKYGDIAWHLERLHVLKNHLFPVVTLILESCLPHNEYQVGRVFNGIVEGHLAGNEDKYSKQLCMLPLCVASVLNWVKRKRDFIHLNNQISAWYEDLKKTYGQVVISRVHLIQEILAYTPLVEGWFLAFYLDCVDGTDFVQYICEGKDCVQLQLLFGDEFVRILLKEKYLMSENIPIPASVISEDLSEIGVRLGEVLELDLRNTLAFQKAIHYFLRTNTHAILVGLAKDQAGGYAYNSCFKLLNLKKMFNNIYKFYNVDGRNTAMFLDLMELYEELCNFTAEPEDFFFLAELWENFGERERADDARMKAACVQDDVRKSAL